MDLRRSILNLCRVSRKSVVARTKNFSRVNEPTATHTHTKGATQLLI